MAKIVSFNEESRRALERGVNALANAVRITLGPKGRNVLLEKQFGAPQIVNDGITVAKDIELEDPLENTGARLIQEVASKTKDTDLLKQSARRKRGKRDGRSQDGRSRAENR